jgi:hypothetical protein
MFLILGLVKIISSLIMLDPRSHNRTLLTNRDILYQIRRANSILTR